MYFYHACFARMLFILLHTYMENIRGEYYRKWLLRMTKIMRFSCLLGSLDRDVTQRFFFFYGLALLLGSWEDATILSYENGS